MFRSGLTERVDERVIEPFACIYIYTYILKFWGVLGLHFPGLRALIIRDSFYKSKRWVLKSEEDID